MLGACGSWAGRDIYRAKLSADKEHGSLQSHLRTYSIPDSLQNEERAKVLFKYPLQLNTLGTQFHFTKNYIFFFSLRSTEVYLGYDVDTTSNYRLTTLSGQEQTYKNFYSTNINSADWHCVSTYISSWFPEQCNNAYYFLCSNISNLGKCQLKLLSNFSIYMYQFELKISSKMVWMSLLSKQINWYLTSHQLYFNHLPAILLKNTVRSCIGIYCCWKASPLVLNWPLFWISKKSNRLVVLERKRTYSLFLSSSD